MKRRSLIAVLLIALLTHLTSSPVTAHASVFSVEGRGGKGTGFLVDSSGIVLTSRFSIGLTENNKVIDNTISVKAAGAFTSNDIELFDPSASCVGLTPALVIDNKIINNDAENILLTPSCLIDFNVIQ